MTRPDVIATVGAALGGAAILGASLALLVVVAELVTRHKRRKAYEATLAAERHAHEAAERAWRLRAVTVLDGGRDGRAS